MPYTHQLKITASNTLATKFMDACAKRDISMTSAISGFMAGFPDGPILRAQGSNNRNLGARRQRRAAVRRIAAYIEEVRNAEETYLGRTCEAVFSYECAQAAVDALEQAVEPFENDSTIDVDLDIGLGMVGAA
jgi:hypothetical protein